MIMNLKSTKCKKCTKIMSFSSNNNIIVEKENQQFAKDYLLHWSQKNRVRIKSTKQTNKD